ncbi:nucleotide sugar dehydrogenase [Sphingobacterium sp. LRF_L2]|uniref:nucleotide sugar dehydrogenase n=1 Tax=Sphingobacterium sp. LRF_L2 TaxID=3369421 RepID=UPI003F642834
MADSIVVIGQGYVGLPLALAFSKHYPVIGYDINEERVEALKSGVDSTKEIDTIELLEVLHLGLSSSFSLGYKVTNNMAEINNATIYIITVPTPINTFNAPDLSYLLHASSTVAQVLKKGDIVIYESTVYPGCTEEDCVPILEGVSKLEYNVDFFVGYSPERINPGDKIHTLQNTIKITSGSTPSVADRVDKLYKKIITAGTHKASSIKVAEASKAIENAQRDVNISFVNELALIFDRTGIDTHEVLAAAATKYNFLPFKPGLVGGHCISVDPYYLAHKASQLGYHPEVILSGRRVNDRMAEFIASKTVKLLIKKGITVRGAKALVLGITFKENCPDIRNSKVVDVVRELSEFGLTVDVYDPWADAKLVEQQYGIKLLPQLPTLVQVREDFSLVGQSQDESFFMVDERDFNCYSDGYDAIVLAVAHEQFVNLSLKNVKNPISVVFDAKAIWPKREVDARL